MFTFVYTMGNAGKPVRIPPDTYKEISSSKGTGQSFGGYIAYLIAEVKRLTAENISLKKPKYK